MGTSDTDKRYSLRIVRTFDASPEMVYQAWTDPRVLKRWLGPTPEFSTPIVEADLRIGGAYRIGMESPEGQLYVAAGVYQEIVPNEKLVFTWRWENDRSSPETLVTVEFKKSGPNTELVFTHENFATEELAKDHQEGWEGALSKLSTLITKREIGSPSTKSPKPS